MFVHLVVLGFFSRPETLFFFFSAPPPHSHKKYSSLSKLRDPKQFPFRSSERKRKKNDVEIDVFCFPSRTLSRRFPIPLVEGRATESFSSESRKIRFARSWRCHLEKRLFRISLEFRNPIFGTGVCERGKSSSSRDRVRASPFVCFRGFASRETRIRRRRLKKKNTTRRVPSSVGGVRPLLAKTAGHPSSDRISAEDTRACSNRP